jgi:metal-responsive CopG/Arc/MetJ family transcriptional regulator
MRARVSITLPEELRRVVDQYAKQQRTTRSQFIEAALQAFITRPPRDEQNARDLEIINRNADTLNREAREVLEYVQPTHSRR